MPITVTRTAASALGALATLGIAAGLLTGSAAQAGQPVDNRAAAAAAPACWTTVTQPSGAGTTIFVTYRNCGSLTERVTVSSSAVDGSGTFTYVGWCVSIKAGESYIRAVPPASFPAKNTHRYTVTTCL